MNLLKLIKNNLFVQNFVASIVSIVPPYLEFTAAKYLARCDPWKLFGIWSFHR